MNRFVEALGFGGLLAAAVVSMVIVLYHDLAPAFLHPILAIGGISPFIGGTIAWMSLQPHSCAQGGYRRAAIAGAGAALITAATATTLYASIDLVTVSLVLVGLPFSIPAAGLAICYLALLNRRRPASHAIGEL